MQDVLGPTPEIPRHRVTITLEDCPAGDPEAGSKVQVEWKVEPWLVGQNQFGTPLTTRPPLLTAAVRLAMPIVHRINQDARRTPTAAEQHRKARALRKNKRRAK